MTKLRQFTSGRLPVVALVGRPNAGKSTLFNRLVGERKAIVHEQPGVTRDLNVAVVSLNERPVLLVDTGGVTDRADEGVLPRVQEQTWQAAQEADVVVALFDGREGLNPLDFDLVDRLRRLGKPVLFAVNKLDAPGSEPRSAEFFRLGVAEVMPLSAAHGRGVSELIDAIVELLPRSDESNGEETHRKRGDGIVAVAIIGRPNVGKSSLLNRLLGYERSIVDDRPGTTRDAIDSPLVVDGQEYLLVDTAGVRRRSRVHEMVERASVSRALRAVERADVALLVIDAVEGLADQDARLARYVWEAGRALVLVFNKWDAVEPRARDPRYFEERLSAAYPFLSDTPRVFLSARTGEGVAALFPVIRRQFARLSFQAPTHELNLCLREAVARKAPPAYRGRPVRLYYAAQAGIRPPRIVIFANYPEAIPESYERYLEGAFRTRFRWAGIPVRIEFRARTGRHPKRPASLTGAQRTPAR